MGSEARTLEEGSAGASQSQALPLQPLRAEPPALKPLQHLHLWRGAFHRLLQHLGSLSSFEGLGRESSRAPVKLFPPGEGSFEQDRWDVFPSPS